MPRPAYKPSEEHLQTAYRGAKAGLSYTEIARAIGIARSTFLRHKDAFSDSLKKGRDELEAVDPYLENVEDALRKRALGFEYIETRKKTGLFYLKDEKGNPDLKKDPLELVKETITTTKQVIPDVTAQIFYLVNRSDGRWRSINTPDAIMGNKVETEDILKAQAERDGYSPE